MQYFPIFIDTENSQILVVGGGEVAARKVELVLKTPAKITVVAPSLSPTLARLYQQGKFDYHHGNYNKTLLADKQLVFVATDDNKLNRQVSEDARRCRVLANVVDSPALCHFITPSIVDRAPVTFAIASEGKSPVLIRYWRARLEALVPQNLGTIARFAGEKRQQIKQLLDSVGKRRRFWERFFSSKQSEQLSDAQILFEQMVSQQQTDAPLQGELSVVQVPKHPDLLTLAALRNMQKADIALYDDTVPRPFLEMIRRDADRELVGDNAASQIEHYQSQHLRVCYLSAKPVLSLVGGGVEGLVSEGCT